MKILAATAITVITGLAVSNFLFAAMTDISFATAFERSYFQAVAIVIFLYLSWLRRKEISSSLKSSKPSQDSVSTEDS